MSDTRFIIIGIVLIFVGVIVMSSFGHDYQAASIESDEFGVCYEYFDDMPPVEIGCDSKTFNQTLFFGAVIGFIGAGVIALIQGVRGNWDSKVRPEDMVGPSSSNNNSNNNSNNTDDDNDGSNKA